MGSSGRLSAELATVAVVGFEPGQQQAQDTAACKLRTQRSLLSELLALTHPEAARCSGEEETDECHTSEDEKECEEDCPPAKLQRSSTLGARSSPIDIPVTAERALHKQQEVCRRIYLQRQLAQQLYVQHQQALAAAQQQAQQVNHTRTATATKYQQHHAGAVPVH